MDPTRAHAVATSLATPRSRRQALKALTATALGAPFALNGIGTAVAAPQEPLSTQPATVDSEAAAAIVAMAQEAMTQYDLKAVILSVSIGTQTVVTTALGESMTGVPATTHMHFRNGNVAVSYLATVLLQLVDQRRVCLDDPLATWLPSLPHAERITLRMLAASRSGYVDYETTPAFVDAVMANPFRAWNPQELIEIGTSQPLRYPPGTSWNYAHTNFVILGLALEQITGQPVATLLHERILAPLGLQDTESWSTAEIRPPVLHAFTSDRGIYEESTYWNPSWTLARGAIMTSSIEDVRKSAIAIGAGTLVSPAAHMEQLAPISVITPEPLIYYGLGVALNNSWVFQQPLFFGYQGVMAYLPAKQIAIAVANTVGEQGSPSANHSALLFKRIATYLAPEQPPA